MYLNLQRLLAFSRTVQWGQKLCCSRKRPSLLQTMLHQAGRQTDRQIDGMQGEDKKAMCSALMCPCISETVGKEGMQIMRGSITSTYVAVGGGWVVVPQPLMYLSTSTKICNLPSSWLQWRQIQTICAHWLHTDIAQQPVAKQRATQLHVTHFNCFSRIEGASHSPQLLHS